MPSTFNVDAGSGELDHHVKAPTIRAFRICPARSKNECPIGGVP